jgi:hypothetical protein
MSAFGQTDISQIDCRAADREATSRLFQAGADLVDPGLGTSFVEIAARRAADANRRDRLVAGLDAHAARFSAQRNSTATFRPSA